ncbi:MAG: chemotaxis protein CheW, partial [Lawsonibacter sp.]|nr:chemotaxis protein CheW [Lawsonibacter sp.]
DYTDRTCVIVINIGSVSTGLIVDCVSEVLTISDDNISEKPEISARGGREYVKGIGKAENHILLLLDCEKLLGEDELENVSAQFQ